MFNSFNKRSLSAPPTSVIFDYVSGACYQFCHFLTKWFVCSCRLHCLESSAEYFDKLIPRHLLFQTGLALSLLLPFKAFINFQKHVHHNRRPPQKQLIFLFPNLFHTKTYRHPSSNRTLIAFLSTDSISTTFPNFPNSSLLKL